mgnify:CR=1 FL=1
MGLGCEAGIFTRSSLGGIWLWRGLRGSFNEALAQRLYQEMQVYQRLPKRKRPAPRSKKTR